MPSEKRAEKRGKRKKSAVKVPDGKHQSLSSQRENVEVGSAHPEGGLKEVKFYEEVHSDGSKFQN